MQGRYGTIGLCLPVPVLMFSLLVVLGACSSKGSAPVYNRTINTPAKEKPVVSTRKRPSRPKRTKSSLTYYLVQPGDTLYSISWRHYLEHEQLAAWNGIKGPKYPIYPGQRLRMKPPELRPVKGHRQAVGRSVTKAVKNGKPAAAVQKAPLRSAPKKVVRAKPEAPRSTPVTERKKTVKIVWSWPTKGRVIQTFSSSDQTRKGIWISGRMGQPVKAAEAGKVVYAGGGLVGYGNLVIIKHNKNYLSAYGYNQKLLVKEGDNIAKGVIVAQMGSPNSGGQPVLHFEIRKQGKPINPLPLLPKK